MDVVEACARVLAPHGSMCIELGDTYSGTGESGWERYPSEKRDYKNEKRAKASADGAFDSSRNLHAWPLAKSLSLIPELFRLTLVYGVNPLTGRQTERWRLRNVVRWVRPNPPVGALGDKFRPATSELMVFCKSAKRYFDLDSVRTETQPQSPRFSQRIYEVDGHTRQVQNPLNENGERIISNPAGAPPLDWWNIPLLEGEEETRYGKQQRPSGPGSTESGRARGPKTGGALEDHRDQLGDYEANPLGAPPLDWWNIPPGGFSGAHYAVWSPELCVKPIKAMCPEKVCRVCGEPSRRIVGEAEYVKPDGRAHEFHGDGFDEKLNRENRRLVQQSGGDIPNRRIVTGFDNGNMTRVAPTLGFSDCGHNDYRPGLVLDPFAGSGTTLAVATGHGRDAIGIDLDERNFELALERVGPFILTLGNIE